MSAITRFVEGLHDRAERVVETADGIEVVARLESNAFKVGQKAGYLDFGRVVEPRRRLGTDELAVRLPACRNVVGPMRVVRIHHEVKRSLLIAAALEELLTVRCVLLWAPPPAEFSLVMDKIPFVIGVGCGVLHFTEHAGQVAVVAKRLHHGRDVPLGVHEPHDAALVRIATGREHTATRLADRDRHVAPREPHGLSCEAIQVRRDLGHLRAVATERIAVQIVGREQQHIQRSRVGGCGDA